MARRPFNQVWNYVLKPGARIAAVIELYDSWTHTRDDADRVISSYFGNRRYIGGSDRRDIGERFYNLIRHQARLGWWLAECGYEYQDGRARMIAQLVLQNGRSESDISDMFNAEEFCPDVLHPAERHLINKLAGQTIDHAAQPGAVKTELPKWLYAELLKLHHENLQAEMAAYNQPAKLDLRVNTLRGSVDSAIRSLEQDGIHNIEKTPYAPNGLRLPLGVNMLVTAAYKDGLIEIQDEASQICVRLADAQPGMTVLDLCAGGGGKTLGMAANMRCRGRILACDTVPSVPVPAIAFNCAKLPMNVIAGCAANRAFLTVCCLMYPVRALARCAVTRLCAGALVSAIFAFCRCSRPKSLRPVRPV